MSRADEAHMRRALHLARRARGRTSPNPLVGAVVVRDDRVVGEGYHRRAGEPHAEVVALQRAGAAARGASLYVNLEPCCHHGRTPPCVETILQAGVSRVIAAARDPFPGVDGGGLAALARGGVAVECGLLEPEARRLNEFFFTRHLLGRPFVTLKMAMTLDGKVATASGDSRWVTGEAARRHVHRLRSEHDAVMVGIGTVLADDPLLTARRRGGRDPVRVIVDARAQTPPTARLPRTAAQAPVWLAVTPAAPAAARRALAAAGAELLELPAAPEERVDLPALLRELARRDILSVLVEGGPRLAGGLLEAGLVDRVLVFIAPRILGDAAAPGPVAGRGPDRMAEALDLRNARLRRFGADWAISGDVHRDH